MNNKILVMLVATLTWGSLHLALAQRAGKVWRIGVFHVGLDHVPPSLQPLRQELKKLGYEEGKNFSLDWRNLPDEAAARVTAQEFVRAQVDLIVAYENQTVRAAKAATSEIPIVFVAVTDPVAEGFVKSFAHPGGNITGFATWGDLYGKEIELFKEIVPGLRRLLVLIDPQDPATERAIAEVRETGAALKVQPVERAVTTERDVQDLFRSLNPGDVDGVFIASQISATNSLPLSSLSPHRNGCRWQCTAKNGSRKARSFPTDSSQPNTLVKARSISIRFLKELRRAIFPSSSRLNSSS